MMAMKENQETFFCVRQKLKPTTDDFSQVFGTAVNVTHNTSDLWGYLKTRAVIKGRTVTLIIVDFLKPACRISCGI